MSIKTESLTSIFNALGDKTRFKIFKLLNQNKDYCVSELATNVGISTAGVSQQLQVLEKAGLVKRQRKGQRICYEVVSGGKVNKQILEILGN